MKKAVTLLLALMICACCFHACSGESLPTEDLPVAGLKFTYPAAFVDAKGVVGTDGAMKLGDRILYAYWYYFGVTPEEFETLLAQDPDALSGRGAVMFYVFSVGNGKDFSAVSSLIGNAFTPEDAIRIGQAEDWTFYLCPAQDPDFTASADPEYAEEYAALCAMEQEITEGFTLSVPFQDDAGNNDYVIRFTTTDLDGRKVSSEEIFAQHEITMVNIWATWCGPCVNELKELQAIHTRFLEKDCAVVGMLDDNDAAKARQLIRENGVGYQTVLAPDNLMSIFPFTGYPTSFFVDRNGVYLGASVVGARTDQYVKTMDSLLADMKK